MIGCGCGVGGEWWAVGRGTNAGGGFISVRGLFPEGFKARVELRNKRDDEWVKIGRVGDLWWCVVPCDSFPWRAGCSPRAVAFAC
jgi:hypothetical protein